MAEAPSPNDGAGKDEKPPNDDAFERQTQSIFKSFMYERLTSQIEEEACEGHMGIGAIPKPVIEQMVKESSKDEVSKEDRMLGKALAEMGDTLDKRYHSEFAKMTKTLGLTSDTAYDTFAKVARKLFQDGINWGRIVALLSFGYEIAVSVIKQGAMGIRKFLQKIVGFVVTFIFKEKIAGWIRRNGGWLAILDLRKNDSNLWLQRLIVGGAIAVCFYFFMLKMKTPKG